MAYGRQRGPFRLIIDRASLMFAGAAVLAILGAPSVAIAQAAPVAPRADDGTIIIEDVLPERGPDGQRPRIKRKDLDALLDRELSIIETLEGLQFGLTKKRSELEDVQKERAQVEAELKAFADKYEAEKAALATHRERIRMRLRAVRQLSRVETLFLVFSSDTFTDFLRRERLLGRLVEGDRVRLDAYRAALAHFQQTRDELIRRRDELAALEQKIFESRAQIEQDRGDHRELLRRIDEERTFYDKYHQELKRRSELVATKIDELEKWDGHGWFGARKGKLAPPINYAIVGVDYGYRVHPRFGTKVLHRGLTYVPNRVPEGRGRLDVRAVYMGKVIYAGWLSGYGDTVILDHTDGYYTVYGHLSKITVRVGEVLKTRERLGFIGKGSLRNADLYFEVRVNGKPVNPADWLKR